MGPLRRHRPVVPGQAPRRGGLPSDPRGRGARGRSARRVSPKNSGSLLDDPSDVGGTYASHVHFYLSPALFTSTGTGLGPYDNLGRNGKPHSRPWRAVMPGLALGGGNVARERHESRV